jgi:DNA topoisomerase VI subunit A
MSVESIEQHPFGGNSAAAPPPVYVACSTKRARRKRADMDAIRAIIHKVVKADPPMTVRQVFYQLVVRGVIEKSEAEYQQTVIRLLTDMRLDGTLPFAWIVDESRRRRVTQTFDSVDDALVSTAKFYRRSALRVCDDYLEIWCEKEALSGALWEATSEYDVPLLVSKGMPSITLLYGTAQQIARAARAGKHSFIYQFGDHDPSGVLIPRTIASRLNELCEKLRCRAPVVKRIALTESHINEFNLPTRPTKRDGNRHAQSFEGNSVELDALPPRELRRMVTEVIERHISQRALDTVRAAEESERDIIYALRNQMPEARP